MKDFMVGRYVFGNSVIHRLDPRTKLISCTLIVTIVLVNYRWNVLLFFISLLTLAIYLSGIKPKLIYKSLRKLRYLLLLTFIFQSILTTGEPLFWLGSISVTREGLTLGVSTVLRLLIFYLSSTLMIMTTSTVRLAAGIESLLTPLTYLKIPVHHFSMIISTSLRFIPTFIEEAEIITKAQRSRGAQFDSPKLFARIRSNIAIIIPLLAASLQRAEDLALAMESRCYTGHPSTIRMSKLNYCRKDFILIGAMLALLIVVVIPF